MAKLTDNFLALEPMLVSHLQARLDALLPTPTAMSPRVMVLSARDVAAVAEASQYTPAVHIVYQGFSIQEHRTDGLSNRIEQTWLAVVATRNVRDTLTGSAARVDAGTIALHVAQALMGFKAAPLTKPLQLANAPAAAFTVGFQYLPLAFVAEVIVSVI